MRRVSQPLRPWIPESFIPFTSIMIPKPMTRAALVPSALGFLVFAVACVSSGKPETAPAARITMPENPEADARARAATAVRTEVLANKIELYLPPALYGEVEIAPGLHSQDQFETMVGRRISIKPPESGASTTNPARVNVGGWRLASNGNIEVLFGVESGPAARIRATGVTLFFRDGVKHQNVARIQVDDDRYSIQQNR